MACASSAGGALALALALAPPLCALALAASGIISAAAAQMRTAIKHLPTDMPVDEGSLPRLSLRLLQSVQIRFFGARDSGPEDVIEHRHGRLLVFWKRVGRDVH